MINTVAGSAGDVTRKLGSAWEFPNNGTFTAGGVTVICGGCFVTCGGWTVTAAAWIVNAGGCTVLANVLEVAVTFVGGMSFVWGPLCPKWRKVRPIL
jgi:hypothetical protein